jgi:hypothetical protein
MTARSAPGYPLPLAVPAGTGEFVAPVSEAQVALRRAAVVLLLLGVTFGQRLCIPLGRFQIPICVPLAYVATYLLCFSGLARIHSGRLMLYALAIVCMIVTLFVSGDVFSPYSFFDLVVIYFVYLFTTDVPREEYLSYLEIYQKFMMVLALVALAQLAGQFLFPGNAYTIFGAVPDQFLLGGYNTRPTLFYGSDFHKSNAEFFLEPSFLSQYMALAVIIELLYFDRWWRIALFGGAIFSSYAGTGMVLLAVFAMLSAVRGRRYTLFALLPVLVFCYLLVQDNPYVTAITGRLTEFQDEHSSAFERFIGPVHALDQLVWPNFSTFMFGRGPGIVEKLGLTLLYPSTFPAVPKLLVEYGMLGTVPFLAFVLYCFVVGTRSLLISAALLMMYFVLSASLLQPQTNFLFFVLVMLMPRQEASAHPEVQQ